MEKFIALIGSVKGGKVSVKLYNCGHIGCFKNRGNLLITIVLMIFFLYLMWFMKSGVDQVAHKTYTLTGRSQTALLDAPYALICSFYKRVNVQQDNFAKQNWTSE